MGANVWRAKMPGSLCPKIKPFSVVSGMANPEGMKMKMNRHKRRRSFLFVLNQQQQSDSREGSQLVLRKHVGHFSGTKASPSQATVLPALKIKFDLFGKALLLNETHCLSNSIHYQFIPHKILYWSNKYIIDCGINITIKRWKSIAKN